MHFINMCALLRRHVEARAVSVLLHSRARTRCTLYVRAHGTRLGLPGAVRTYAPLTSCKRVLYSK